MDETCLVRLTFVSSVFMDFFWNHRHIILFFFALTINLLVCYWWTHPLVSYILYIYIYPYIHIYIYIYTYCIYYFFFLIFSKSKEKDRELILLPRTLLDIPPCHLLHLLSKRHITEPHHCSHGHITLLCKKIHTSLFTNNLVHWYKDNIDNR